MLASRKQYLSQKTNTRAILMVLPRGLVFENTPAEDIDQRFGVIMVEPFAFGGSIFTIMFAESPHLAVNVWVYLENGVSPDARSFQVTDLTAEQRVEIANKFWDYLTDDRFTG